MKGTDKGNLKAQIQKSLYDYHRHIKSVNMELLQLAIMENTYA